MWIEGTNDLDTRVMALPFEVRRTWQNSLWVRWARAEHALLTGALSCASDAHCWSALFDEVWLIGTHHFTSLLEALESIARGKPNRQLPTWRIIARTSWPVSGSAYSMAVKRAVGDGLTAISGDAEFGFVAKYPSGDRRGFSLIEVLG